MDIEKLLSMERMEVSFINHDINKDDIEKIEDRHCITDIALANIINVSRMKITLWRKGILKPKGSSAVLLALILENPEFINKLYDIRTVRGK